MAMDDCDGETKTALLSVIEECLAHPDKQKEFIDEGTTELLIELCKSNKGLGIKAYAAAALAVLCHQNNSAKAKIVGQGGILPLLSLCSAVNGEKNNLSDLSSIERLLAHEQSAAVLQKLAFQNAACQSELVSVGTIRYLVKLCDVFNPAGDHGNCCQVKHEYSKIANQLFSDLTKGKKLIGKVNKLCKEDVVKAIDNLIETGAEINIVSGHFNDIYSIELYDTTTDKDVLIAMELIHKGLAWPDLSQHDVCSSEDAGKYVKLEDKNAIWNDITLREVIDAGHFWAHVGGEAVHKRIEEIQKFLFSQEMLPVSGRPQPGDIVCVSETISGHKDLYRACIMDVTSSIQGVRAKVFAIDNGFTTVVSGSSLFVLPTELSQFAPQISLCCLSGVQAPPKSAAVLQYAAGALRNLSQENHNFILYITNAGGIEALLKLCTIPVKHVLVQALGALRNLSFGFTHRARIGYLGGVQILLDVCRQYADDDDILELSVGTLQNLMLDTLINRSRVNDAQGLAVLVNIYCNSNSDAVKMRVLGALANLFGKSNDSSSSTSSVPPAVAQQHVLDLRGVIDEGASGQTRYSFSMPTNDGYAPKSDRRKRRRNLRSRKFIDPKPTHVSLSADNLKSLTDDSGTTSDSDDDYGGRWTSEGDTDGELLLKDGKIAAGKHTELKEFKSEKYYVQTHHVPFSEDETHEFRSQTNIHDVSRRSIARAVCAFLNNRTCGTLYIGVHKDGVVAGVRIRRKERDMLRLGMDELMDRFHPHIKHDMYQVEFVPIVRPSGSESSITRIYVDDRFIVEISVIKCTGLVYSTPNKKCYFRHKSANIELSTQEVREKTIEEQEATCNAEMKRLRKDLKEMRKQLSVKSENEEDKSQGSVVTRTEYLNQRDERDTEACVIS